MNESLHEFLMGCCVVVSAGAGIGCHDGSGQGTGDGNEVVIENPHVEWGEVWPGNEKEFDYVLRNESNDKTFVIEQVEPSCACTVLSLGSETVGPGENVDVATRVLFGETPGSFSTSVIIEGRFEDGGESVARRVTAHAEIVDLVHLNRRSLDFGVFSEDEKPIRRRLRITKGKAGGELSGFGVGGISEVPGLSHEMGKVRDGVTEIVFEYDPSRGRARELRGTVSIRLLEDGEVRGRRTLNLGGRKLEELDVKPDSLLLWAGAEQKRMPFQVRIVADSGDAIRDYTIDSEQWVSVRRIRETYSEGRDVLALEGLLEWQKEAGRRTNLSIAARTVNQDVKFDVPVIVFEEAE